MLEDAGGRPSRSRGGLPWSAPKRESRSSAGCGNRVLPRFGSFLLRAFGKAKRTLHTDGGEVSNARCHTIAPTAGLLHSTRTHRNRRVRGRFRAPGHLRAKPGLGFQPEASFCFLKCVLVQNGCARYSGSTTSEITNRIASPPGRSNRSKYSVNTVRAL